MGNCRSTHCKEIKAASDRSWSNPMASGSPRIVRLTNRSFLLQIFVLQKSSIHRKVIVEITSEACCKNGEKMTRTEIFWKDILYLQNIIEHVLQSNQGKASWCCGTLLREVGSEDTCQRALPKSSPSDGTQRSKGFTWTWTWFRLPWWSTKELELPNYQRERVLSQAVKWNKPGQMEKCCSQEEMSICPSECREVHSNLVFSSNIKAEYFFCKGRNSSNLSNGNNSISNR